MNGYEKDAGVISCPDGYVCPIVRDGESFTLDNDFVYELNDGDFCPFVYAPHMVRLVNEELKELLETYAEKEWVDFVPVIVRSTNYGDRKYYIVHFLKIYDVVDEENTIYDPPGWIMKLRIDKSKVKNLHVFNSQPHINDLIVSAKLYKDIKRRNLHFGISFVSIQSTNN